MTPLAVPQPTPRPPRAPGLSLLNRRLGVLTAMAALLAHAGGAGFTPLPTVLTGIALLVALRWHPEPELSARLERLWLPVALILVGRALYHVLLVQGDVVLPVVDLLLLLLAAEALRSLDAHNDARLHALAFALLLAATAYRPGILFALAFVAYVVSATLALLVGHLRREMEGRGAGDLPVSGRLLAGTALLSGVVLAASATVFLAFPRVSEGFTGRGAPGSASMAGFSETVSLGSFGSRILPNPEIILRVEFPQGPPPDPEGLYFRGRSYDRFDGLRWTRSRNLPPASAPLNWYEERWGGRELVQRVYAVSLDSRVLFGSHPVVNVLPDSRIQPALDAAGDLIYWGGGGSPVYTVVSLSGRPSPQELRSVPATGFVPARSFYLQLPSTLSPRVAELADSLAGGHPGRFDQVQALLGWFRSEFRYTTELPRSARETTVEHFLFQRREGHCEYFASGMVLMLRTLGIPARMVNGFLGGRWNDVGGYLAVTGNQAHAWVEVWFPGFGWVPFDPTPPGSVGAAAGTGRLNAGRFLLDGLQHRWSKWVLDYSGSQQADLLERAVAALRVDERLGARGGRDRRGGFPAVPLWIGAAVLAAFLAFRFRRIRSLPPPSAAFVGLRRAWAREGLTGAESLPPLAFLEAVRSWRSPAAPWTERAVRLYLERRFSGAPADPGADREVVRMARRARAELRRSGGGGGRSGARA